MRIEKNPEKSEIRNSKSEMEGPMLFPRNALPFGPQASFSAEMGIAKVKGGSLWIGFAKGWRHVLK